MLRRLRSQRFLRLTAGALAVVLAFWTGPAEASAALPHVREPAAASPALERVAAAAATTITVGGAVTTLAWDYNDKLTGITYPNSSTNSFTNSDLGVRTAKTDSGGSTTYLRDGATVIADSRADYATGGASGLISERASGASKWYHADALGGTRGLTNGSQAVTDTLETDAWGLTVSSTGSTPSPFGFVGGQGYQTDPDSGLMLLGARYYDPSLGRFLSRDPLGYGGGDVNLYRYCGNDPVNQADPLGLASLGAWIGGGLGAGLVILVAVATPFSLPVVGTIFLTAAIGSALDSPGDDPLGTVTDAIEVTATLEAGTTYTAGVAPIMLTRPGGSLGPPTGGGGGALPPGGGGSGGGSGIDYAVTPSGVSIPIPPGYVGRPADNGKGIVFQFPGASGNQGAIRYGDPQPGVPGGYVRYYNDAYPNGQPINPFTGKPGSQQETHIGLPYTGPLLGYPR